MTKARIPSKVVGPLRGLLGLTSHTAGFAIWGEQPTADQRPRQPFDLHACFGRYEAGLRTHRWFAAMVDSYLLSRREEIRAKLQEMAEPLGLAVVDVTGNVHVHETIHDAAHLIQTMDEAA